MDYISNSKFPIPGATLDGDNSIFAVLNSGYERGRLFHVVPTDSKGQVINRSDRENWWGEMALPWMRVCAQIRPRKEFSAQGPVTAVMGHHGKARDDVIKQLKAHRDTQVCKLMSELRTGATVKFRFGETRVRLGTAADRNLERDAEHLALAMQNLEISPSASKRASVACEVALGMVSEPKPTEEYRADSMMRTLRKVLTKPHLHNDIHKVVSRLLVKFEAEKQIGAGLRLAVNNHRLNLRGKAFMTNKLGLSPSVLSALALADSEKRTDPDAEPSPELLVKVSGLNKFTNRLNELFGLTTRGMLNLLNQEFTQSNQPVSSVSEGEGGDEICALENMSGGDGGDMLDAARHAARLSAKAGHERMSEALEFWLTSDSAESSRELVQGINKKKPELTDNEKDGVITKCLSDNNFADVAAEFPEFIRGMAAEMTARLTS